MPRRAGFVLALLLAAGCQTRGADGRGESRGAEPGRRFTLAVTGDVLIHGPVAAAAARAGGGYDFGPLLAGPAALLRDADLALCHLETPLVRPGAAPSYGPRFAVPGEVAAALAGAGYDACSTASNHSLDAGPAGVEATLEVLDRAGVRHTGTARDAAEAARPLLLDAGDVQVGLLSYTYGFNPGPGPAGPEWLANRIRGPAILADARRLRAAGAAFVVVSLHWGREYAARPDQAQRALGRRLLGSPAVDLVVGHHAHVVQPVGRVGDKFAVYGLGNFLAGQPDRCCPSPQDGVVVTADVERAASGWRVARLAAAPTFVETATYRVRLVGAALSEAALSPASRKALVQSWCATTAGLRGLGADVAVAGPAPRPAVRCAGN